jgi:hypothetical protein
MVETFRRQWSDIETRLQTTIGMKNKIPEEASAVAFESSIDQRSRSFEHTYRVGPAHKAQDTPWLVVKQGRNH